jgi:predicted nucleotidyltransferase
MLLTHEKIVEAVSKAAGEFPLIGAEYFGSYAEGNATEESDVDLLVRFSESAISILTIIRLKRFLEEYLEKTVDVIHAPIPPGAILEIGKTVSILSGR